MKRALSILSALVIQGHLSAQIHIDKPIRLIGVEPSDRRISGLEDRFAPSAALTARVAQEGTALTSGSVVGDQWNITLEALGPSLVDGSFVLVRVPEVSGAAIFVVLNGAGPYPLLRDNSPIDASTLIQNTMLSLVYANGAFHVLNGSHDLLRACPEGTVAVNTQFCIEPQERGGGDYFQAGLGCASAGLRLCTWGEFVAGCGQSLSLGLVAMTNNWEWTASTSNEDNSARIAGSGSCMAAGNSLSTGSTARPYRCCFTR